MSTICARVLAAALLAGAIAAALALPTLYDSAQEGRHALTAPSPSLERSVHVPALTADALPWTEGRQPGRDLQSAGLIALRSSAARSAGPGGSPSRAGGSRLVERPAAPTPQPSPTAPRPDPAAGPAPEPSAPPTSEPPAQAAPEQQPARELASAPAQTPAAPQPESESPPATPTPEQDESRCGKHHPKKLDSARHARDPDRRTKPQDRNRRDDQGQPVPVAAPAVAPPGVAPASNDVVTQPATAEQTSAAPSCS